jgi:beta-lactamase superfamily II metal-dependent hydrolase
MYFSLDVRRARKGDCLLLHFGSNDAPGLVMIDGGPRHVYGPHLKPRLQQIKKARKLDQDPLPVDLLMVSHVDDDHIQGILDLTKELIEAEQDSRPPLVQVLGFWHNSFDAIIGTKPAELTAAFKDQYGVASVEGDLPSDATIDDDAFSDEPERRPEEEVIVDTLKVLASVEQGYRLRSDADRLAFPLNPEFDGKLLIATAGGTPVEIGQGLTFTVVGPMKPELERLQEKHDEWLAGLKKKGVSPPAALAAYVDKSVPNLSSVVVLAEVGNKRMLLTGDARGDKILDGLELVGLLPPGGHTHVDLLKVPHHGSANNLERGFFERITADHYVLSGNGEHGNPERESLHMLVDARGDRDFTIHLTYPIEDIDVERENDWKKEQQKEKNRKKKNPTVTVRPNWSRDTHSLAAFFEHHEDLAKKVRIVDANKPHLIDLLDPVTF